MEPFWEPNGHISHPVKYESEAAVSSFSYCTENGLNFSASTANYSEDDADFPSGRRGKASRQDPLSHRIIEKRRRDRMNSCLADLSRLIPPQYQRKGRGRIEKTEIIEMSIRYMKQLQNQEFIHKENFYKMGFEDCLKHAANFFYPTNREISFKLVDFLKEKKECLTSPRTTNLDSISASSGSPPAHNVYHPITPLNQMHDLLTSDMEHSNSNDHNDVKDLSIRSQPQQAPVITSTAPAVHLDTTSTLDFDSSRASSVHLDNGHHHHDSVLRTVRMRKLSESSHHEHEHNNNSYKFKNYIQQRFSKDSINLHHDDNLSIHTDCGGNKSPSIIDLPCSNHPISKKSKLCLEYMESSSCDEKPTTNGISDFKPDIQTNNSSSFPSSMYSTKPSIIGGGGGGSNGLVNGVGNGAVSNNNSNIHINHHHNPVPIFALHAQGRFYIPLSIDYDVLLPYLGSSSDLLDKHCGQLPPLHAININVNFTQPRVKAAPCQQQTQKPLRNHNIENMLNDWYSTINTA